MSDEKYKLEKQDPDGSWNNYLINTWSDRTAAELVASSQASKYGLTLRVAAASSQDREQAENIDLYTANRAERMWAIGRVAKTGRPFHPWGDAPTKAAL